MARLRIIFLVLVFYSFVQCSGSKREIERPNILFAIMDDVTYLHMSAYGCKWVKTPNFDRVAQNGLLFERAYTNNAKCAPSRANILTGRNSWQLEEAANHWPYFPQKYISFAESLSQNGYFVGYTGKGYAPAVVQWKDGSKRDLLVQPFNQLKTIPPTSKISTTDYASNFDAFLNSRNNKDQPFFFWYGGLEPHRSYDHGSGISIGHKNLNEIHEKDIFKFWPNNDSIRTDLLDYAFEIEYFDKQLGKMLDKLEKIGELKNTIIVVTSDNGMPFPRVKGQTYEYSNHLPLAIMWADGIKKPGRKVEDYISFIDFAPTFLELAGVDLQNTNMLPITGHSFVPLFYEGKTFNKGDNFVLVGKERHDVGRPHDQGYPTRGIVKEDMLYLHNFKPERWPAGNPETGYLNTDGSATKSVILQTVWSPQQVHYWEWNFGKRPQEELYNLKNDPDCIINLIGNKECVGKHKMLKELLFNQLRLQGDPRVLGRGDLFDQYKYSDNKSTNFYERYFNKDNSLGSAWVEKSDFQNLSDINYIRKK